MELTSHVFTSLSRGCFSIFLLLAACFPKTATCFIHFPICATRKVAPCGTMATVTSRIINFSVIARKGADGFSKSKQESHPEQLTRLVCWFHSGLQFGLCISQGSGPSLRLLSVRPLVSVWCLSAEAFDLGTRQDPWGSTYWLGYMSGSLGQHLVCYLHGCAGIISGASDSAGLR